MRIPEIINKNTKTEYDPSPQTLELFCEVNRKIHSENFSWDKDLCPSLATICVQVISKNFETRPLLDELPCADRLYLVEILSTDLPLELVVPLIEEEVYWKRRFSDKFGLLKADTPKDCNWKRIFLGRVLQETIEQAQPQYYDEDNMDDLLDLLNPYVSKLIATQLQAWKPPLTMLEEDIPEIYPIEHINFQPILRRLTSIEEIDLRYGMNNIGEKFNWNMFKLSVGDCQHIGRGISSLNNIKILKIHRSRLEDEHARALARELVNNRTLLELDLSHCEIKDQGAMCIAKVLMVHPTLEKLIMTNNRIGEQGGQAFGFALLKDECNLTHLNVRLNPLGHGGALGIMRALIRGTKLLELNIAACDFEDDTSVRIGQMLKMNRSLKVLDVSSNLFNEEAVESLMVALGKNDVIEVIDVRETCIPKDYVLELNKCLRRNKRKWSKDEDDEDSEEGEEEEEEDEEIQEQVSTGRTSEDEKEVETENASAREREGEDG